jgi:hypothetical protein
VTERAEFPVEPWCLRERGLNLDLLARSESLFAMSNGHIGLRGNLDEGEPYGIPGTYLNSFYEVRPLPNAVQWRGLRLEVDIEPGRATYGLRDRTDSTLAFRHHGVEVTVTAGKPVTALISKRPPLLPRPPQPPGREPLHQGESQSSSLAAGRAAAAVGPYLPPAEARASSTAEHQQRLAAGET